MMKEFCLAFLTELMLLFLCLFFNAKWQPHILLEKNLERGQINIFVLSDQSHEKQQQHMLGDSLMGNT